MIIFILGYIAGIVTAILIVTTLTYFRRVIERKVNIIEKQIKVAGPRLKGFIIEPPSEAEEVRAQIIAKNKAQGKDTPISELL
uniref:Uncharacterized protein n=1 Tax=viral metagenome TaxID=1070528 RepID=A0A6H1ZQH6_9ZZZZ